MTTNNRFVSLSNSQKYFQEISSRLNAYFRHTTRNPEWTLMNIISRSAILRDILRHFRRKPQLNSYDLNKSLFYEVDVDFVVDSLKRDGYFAGIKLPKCKFKEIMYFAHSKPCFGNSNTEYGFIYSQKKLAEEKSNNTFSSATYFNSHLFCPAITELANDPTLMMIAAKYFGGQPLYTDSRLWWTFATDETNYDVIHTSSFFHYDVDDYSCLRFFFYLTDVDLKNGPHILLRGSHTKKKFSQIISLGRRQDQDIIDYYGAENVITVCGEAGSGFAEDPFCFHKATRPVLKDRLILQLRYATKDYGVLKNTTNHSKLKNIV